MDSRKERAESLSSQILMHKKLYYAGRSVITDEEFDALEDELRQIEPEHPVLQMVGYPLKESLAKIPHDPPMLSLAKTYEIDDLVSFVEKNPCVCMDKIDGMSLAVEYNSHGQLVVASTRGNGVLGEDVTERVFHMATVPKKVPIDLVAAGLSVEARLEVRGEVFFPISAFAAFSDRFDSYRNAVPGTFGRKEIEGALDVLRVLKFFAFEIVVKDGEKGPLLPAQVFAALGIAAPHYLDKLRQLHHFGFLTAMDEDSISAKVPKSAEELTPFVQNWFQRSRDFQIDGIVFRIADEVLWHGLGTTSHHPRGSLAFKQTGETASTKILAIEESVGRSGKITFRARLEPVFLSGATISYATLHNAEFIENGGYAPGAIVKIKRSGEVIPAIIGLETAAEVPYVIPTTCPCGFPVSRQGPDLVCKEKRPCPPRDQEALVHFVHGLDILGVSDKIILRLRAAGLLNEPSDLFRLRVEDLIQMEGFGRKSAENIVSAIQDRRKLPLAAFLTALGLKRGGAVKCKEVAARFETLERVRAATPEDLMKEKGWAQKSAEDFVQSLHEKSLAIDHLLEFVEVIPQQPAPLPTGSVDHPYFGKRICITGTLSKPRDEYKSLLENVGAKLVDSVTSKTDFLVCNEPSQSSKYQQALKLSIPILTESEFSQKL